MGESFFPRRPALVLPFRHRGRRGTVRVWYAAVSGPGPSGFGVVAGFENDRGVRGFPAMKATVDYTGRGYESLLGWVQVVAHVGTDGRIEDLSPDLFPMMRGLAQPFAVFGYLPTFYDAPYWPGRPQIHWRADTFLCPIVIRDPAKEPLGPLVGFRWGFRIDRAGGPPSLLPIAPVGADAWAVAAATLRRRFRRWRFAGGDRPTATARSLRRAA